VEVVWEGRQELGWRGERGLGFGGEDGLVALCVERAVSIADEDEQTPSIVRIWNRLCTCMNSLDQRRDAAATNGVPVLGEDDELCERILDLSGTGSFGFQQVQGLRCQKENASGKGLR
jgi:hypothetical protein